MKLVFCILLLGGPIFFGAAHAWASMFMAAVLYFLLLQDPKLLSWIRVLPRASSLCFSAVFVFLLFQYAMVSVNPYDSLQETLRWFALIIAFLFILKHDLKFTESVAACLIAVGVVETVYAFNQLSGETERVLWRIKEFHRGYATGTYFNRNHFSGFLELCLGLNLGMILTAAEEKKKRKMLIWILTAAVLTAGFAATGSRMGYISFVFALLIMIPALRHLSSTLRIVLIFLFAAVLCLMLFSTRDIISERFHEAYASIQTWDGGRVLAWKSSMKIVSDHPLLGIGLGNFEWIFPQYQPSELLLAWDHAHNDYVELLTELGIPAFLIWLGAWGSLLAYCLSRIRKVRPASFGFVWGGLISVLSYAFHGLTDFNSALYANVFIFVVLAAVIFRHVSDSTGRHEAGGS